MSITSKPTENLRRQHQELLSICESIEACFGGGQVAPAAKDIAKLLAKLTGQLKVHLSMEDKVMYPRLMAHQERNVSELSRKYQTEMGTLVGVYTKYSEKYRTPEQIEQDSQGFIASTKEVFAALRTRIAREDNELYNIVDHVGL